MSFDKPIGIFIFDYAWVVFIFVTIINALLLKMRSNKIVEEHPDLQEGYDQLFKGYLFYLNIPWLVMGIGMIFGGVPSTFTYFAPRHGNLFVIAFYISLVTLYLLGIWWIYFKGGAEFLVKYYGSLYRKYQSPLLVKTYFGISLLGGIVAMAVMWFFL